MTRLDKLTGIELVRFVRQHPEELSDVFHYLDSTDQGLPDQLLDMMLDIQSYPVEKRLNTLLLLLRHNSEQLTYEPTPYDYIRDFLHFLQPTAQDTIYDLGCGYGRFVFYGALTTEAHFKGIEIVADRIEKARQIQDHFHIPNAEFILGNVTGHHIQDGSAFFLFNPFTEPTFLKVNEMLREVAKLRPIHIAAWGGGSTEVFKIQPWLRTVGSSADKKMRIYESTS